MSGGADLASRRRERLRDLPSVDELLRDFDGAGAVPRRRVVEAVRAVLDESRRAVLAADSVDALERVPVEGSTLRARIEAHLAAATAWHLDRVINATGVVLHTNLGRALLGADGAGASRPDRRPVLEPRAGRADEGARLPLRPRGRAALPAHRRRGLAGGQQQRGGRPARAGVARRAAARWWSPAASWSRSAAPSAFPTSWRESGARLVEVGTTNRTRLADYAAAIGPDTGLLLKVHPSNYRVIGFTESVSTRELAELGRDRSVPVMEDLGSGSLRRSPAVGRSRTSRRRPRPSRPAPISSRSPGDKLLGGPQAGIVVGRRALVERCRKNPLNRALRIDKLTLAALEATLRAYEDPERARQEIPTLRMLTEPEDAVRRRAQRCLRGLPAKVREPLGARVVAGQAQVGGGALPTLELPTAALALGSPGHSAEALDARLRAGRPPVIGRIADDRLLLDCRTIADDEVPLVIAAVRALV